MASASQEELPIEEVDRMLAELDEDGYVSDSDDDGDVTPDYSTCVVVRGLPKVGEDKYAKLLTFVQKLFAQLGTIVQLDMPVDPATGSTGGAAFLQFALPQEAQKALETVNGYQLDRVHQLRLHPYTDLLLAERTDPVYREPAVEAFPALAAVHSFAQHDLLAWLGDAPVFRDQFVLRHADNTEVWWCSSEGRPQLDYNGERQSRGDQRWCRNQVAWSPHGTYLGTFTSKGIALWGGPEWSQVGRFAHSNVFAVDFSPKESFMVTWDGTVGPLNTRAIVVWDVRSGAELRRFPYPESAAGAWPVLRWSSDEKLLAQAGDNVVRVYQVPAMTLLDKRSLPAPGVRDAAFSPAGSVLAYWCSEANNNPAHISLIELPSRRELRRKNMVNMKECAMFWHGSGDFLAVHVTRLTKSKKSELNGVELFRLRDRNVPVESIEYGKQSVTSFAWEPSGVRFSIVHSEVTTQQNVSFYTMGAVRNGQLALIRTLEKKQINRVHWCPRGRTVVMSGLDSGFSGVLEWFDVEECEMLEVQTHQFASQVHWDPSGRVVATVVAQRMKDATARETLDNGYRLWNVYGEPLSKHQINDFYQFLWRPRPPLMLTEAEQEEVKQTLSKSIKRYKEQDRREDRRRKAREMRSKRRQRREFLEFMGRRSKQWVDLAPQRAAMRGDADVSGDEAYSIEEYVAEEPIQKLSESSI